MRTWIPIRPRQIPTIKVGFVTDCHSVARHVLRPATITLLDVNIRGLRSPTVGPYWSMLRKTRVVAFCGGKGVSENDGTQLTRVRRLRR